MIINSIKLQNFRSYKKQSFEFSPDTTLIAGNNTTGKTNILEALYLLSLGKSFRADKDSEMIRWNESIGRITGDMVDFKLEIVLTTGEISGQKTQTKKLLVNGISRRSLDFVGNLKSVLFWPEDLELVTDSPSLRRKYLDRVLVQTDREYRRNILSYERGLRQRNKLLDLINEGKASRSQLLFWNQLLIKTGGYMTDVRAEFLEYINGFKMPKVRYLIEYDKSVISESRLEQYKDEEIAAKATLVGPHRDDFIIKIANYPKVEIKTNQSQLKDLELSKYGSRGEQRLGVLWIKLAELSYIQEKTQDRPLLLLDDIFSEFDDIHRILVLDLIKNYQTIITTAEDDVVGLLDSNNINYQLIRLT